MNEIRISNFETYLKYVNSIEYSKGKVILYRGQDCNDDLLPNIAREDPTRDTTEKEKQMLEELKRRSQFYLQKEIKNDWEWLVYAQHFGMRTRLLDWTSNPLVALWFACSSFKKGPAYVYILNADNTFTVDQTLSPFEQSKTRIYRPAMNNERIIAQSGWFTVHRYTKWGKFIGLNKNLETIRRITVATIPHKHKQQILEKLSIFGINHQFVYPGITGICQHLNWSHKV